MLFTNDLRLDDNLALHYACQNGPILPLFILNAKDEEPTVSNVWKIQALNSLNDSLQGNLLILRGNVEDILLDFASKFDYCDIFINDKEKFARLESQTNIKLHQYSHNVLFEPEQVLKADGSFYQKYAAFYKKALQKLSSIRKPILKPKTISFFKHQVSGIHLQDYKIDHNVDLSLWEISEEGGLNQFISFLEQGVEFYDINRDDLQNFSTSRISPYLHFGQLSIVRVLSLLQNRNFKRQSGKDAFIKELIFREFSYYLYFCIPNLDRDNFYKKWDTFQWSDNLKDLECWQNGQTGIPIIDAAMLELKQKGTMHNRLRMLTATYLIKNLRINWVEGAKWFEKHLIDADTAINSFSWQWLAGTGPDHMPYFRFFNPAIQSKKVDPTAKYIKKYLPALNSLSAQDIHNIGVDQSVEIPDYFLPIVDLQKSKQKYLDLYKEL